MGITERSLLMIGINVKTLHLWELDKVKPNGKNKDT
jgi:hypothetical protein